eukprot:TRINITY_DN62911_c0_g1_i1.p1 TRINITY_DN62911_c0_g1~~TRINITY_DN62911_c0_g1_i1.p1  ORF type:complete len:589 (+),score=97.27 TRINITY_DN62911_c0_g1_i1:73-1767(+)
MASCGRGRSLQQRRRRRFVLGAWTCTLAGAWLTATRGAVADPVPAADDASVAAASASFERLVSWVQSAVDADVSAEGREGLPLLREVLDLRAPRTLVAARALRSGELLMRLPTRLLMHAGYYKAKREQEGPGDAAAAGGGVRGRTASHLAPLMHKGLSGGRELTTFVAPQTWLALYLMEHRRLGPASEWSAYLDMLPSAFPTNPAFYSDEDWRWLTGSTFIGRAAKHRDSFKSQFETVADLVPGFADNYTLREFMWARTAISSRVFGWRLAGVDPEDTDFMVPLGDMFNHRSPKQVEWIYNATLQTLDYWVREDVPQGEELLISYGAKCNSQYLLHYGFALPGVRDREPPLSTVRVAVPVDAGVPDRAKREAWLVKSRLLDAGSPLPPEEFELKAKWVGSGPDHMIGYARLLSLPGGDEFTRRMKSGSCRAFSTPPRCDQPLGLEIEKAALQRCKDAVSNALRSFPTTLEEDEILLSEENGQVHEGVPRFLVILRRDEKTVLRWWERYFEIALRALALPNADAIEKLADDSFGSFSAEGKYLKVTLSALVTVEASAAASAVPEL